MSLRVAIGLTIMLLVGALAVIRGALVGAEAEELLRRETGASLAALTESMADKLEGDMQARAAQVAVLATFDSLRQPAAAQRVVNELVARDQTLSWVGVTDEKGVVLAGSNGVLAGRDISQRPVFQRAQKGLFVGDVHEAVLLASLLPNPGGEPMKFVDVSAPLKGPDGRTVGVLAAHYSWSWVRDVVRRLLAPAHDREGLEVFVVSRNGVVLMANEGELGRNLDLTALAGPQNSASGWRTAVWPDGREYLTGYAAGAGKPILSDFGWIVLARQPVEKAFAPAYAMRAWVTTSGAVLAVLFGGIGWLAAGWITRPLRAIASAADRMRQGDRAAVIPDIGGMVEIRLLSLALRELVDGLTASNAALAVSNEALARMSDIAHQDRLTTLPNRRYFEQYLEAATAHARAGGGKIVVLYIDLDGFKPINDNLGHDAGDEVLRQVAARLASSLRQNDVAARIGGDEFAAVLTAPADKCFDLNELPLRIIAAINEPIRLPQETAHVGCSIGVAMWPDHGQDLQAVLKHADSALYEAKRRGKNRAVAFSELEAAEA